LRVPRIASCDPEVLAVASALKPWLSFWLWTRGCRAGREVAAGRRSWHFFPFGCGASTRRSP